jgi:anti-anti-sigma regulatory factor
MSPAQTVAEEVTVLRLPDGALTADSLQVIRRYLEESGTPLVYLDLGGIRLPTAEGLGALVVLNQELRACGGALVLFNLTAATSEVFALTRLVEVLDVRRIEKAIA